MGRPREEAYVSFLLQLVKLIVFAAIVVAGYVIYRPEAVAPFAPKAVPYARMAHGYLPAALTGEKPAAAPTAAAPAAPPVSVLLGEAQRKTVPYTVTEIGTAQAVASVALRSHFDATVMKVQVADGAEVKAGDVLFTLDDRQAQAQLAMAQAQIAKDEAQLEQAQRDVTRYTDLVARSATPILNLDNAKTASASSRAAVIGDAASIRNMQVVLGWYTIAAPISGRVGVVNIKEGNIVKGGDNSAAGVLATINQISPIYVALSVSQKLLPALREAMANGVKVVAIPQGSTRHAEGKLALFDNTVDPLTGTIVIRAQFDNYDELLWPGQLCNLTLTLREEPNTVVAPREAIQTSQNGNFVFTVKDRVAHVTPVTVGRTEGSDTVVTSGLERRREARRRRRAAVVRGRQGRPARPRQGGELMGLPELCIRRPVMTSLLMLSFVVFGLFGYRQLPVSALPRVDFPTIAVNASLPGASPDTMASAVAGPLERAFATIPGINMMTSSSSLGVTQIVMQFDLERNIDGAALDVQSNISATLRKLPQTLPAPPSFQKINPADSPILFIALVSKTLPLTTVDDYAEQVFAEQISQIAGVSQVLVFGQQKFAVRVAVDPDAAAARGLTLDNVGAAVAAANSSTPVGALLGHRQNVTVDATGQIAARRSNTRISSSRGATARRCGSARSRPRTIRSKISRSPRGSATSAPSCSPCSGNPTPTPWRWSTTSRPRFPTTPRSCRRPSNRWCSTTARCRSGSRSTTCNTRCCCRSCWSSSSSSCS